MECYYCEKNKDNICFYYCLKPISYIESKNYDSEIHKQYKPICQDCVFEFILKRQQGFKICKTCKCYYKKTRESKTCEKNLCDNCCEKDTNSTPIDNKLECFSCRVDFRKLCRGGNGASWGRIHDSKTFSYGLSGSYILTDGIFNAIGYICDDCLKNYKYEPHLPVECGVCKNKFQSCFDNSTKQGLDCASTVYDTYIIGNYGSRKYDEEKIFFTTERPKDIKYKSTICDDCITDLIKSGICLAPKSWEEDQKYSGYVPFEISNPMDLNKN
ncbi:hypothetical protein [Moumouvirus maliensis]|nr:hypothetical protein [Moumouvirus maliensis]